MNKDTTILLLGVGAVAFFLLNKQKAAAAAQQNIGQQAGNYVNAAYQIGSNAYRLFSQL